MTAACPRCGFDNTPAVASWSFVVELPLPNANDRITNVKTGRAYRNARDGWTFAIKAKAPIEAKRADKFRRVQIVRFYSGREREWDHDNLVSGCKMVVDALVRATVLLDDSGRWANVAYRQERGERTEVRFTVEELG